VVGSDVQNLVGVIVLVLTLLGLFWYALREPPLLRLLSRVALTKLRSARDGDRVKVLGTIRKHDGSFVSPLTGKRGVWSITGAYKLRDAWNYHRYPWWETQARELQSRDFLMDEGDDLVRVKGSRLRVLSNPDLDTYLELRREGFNERAIAFLTRHRVRLTNWLGGSRIDLRLQETVLEPGDQVAVLGLLRVLSPVPDDGIAYEITPLPEGYVVVSDWPETFY